MTTLVAAPPATKTSSLCSQITRDPHNSSPLRYASILHASRSPATMSSAADPAPPSSSTRLAAPRSSPRSNGSPPHSAGHSPPSTKSSDGKTSPHSLRAPMIRVKKEPHSPSLSSRPRPRALDLSSSGAVPRGPQTAGPSAPLTSRDSAGLAIKDLGVACLSPGFQTHDPSMREQLQRSLSVRDQQRQLIEARQKGTTKPLSSHDTSEPAQRTADGPLFGMSAREPQTSRRKGPPPGLAIHAPSAASFASERVIQSAPLHHSFTGLRQSHPHQQHALGQPSHIQHVPATQTANRLPPIADVFANERLDAPPSSSFRPNYHAAQPSPSHPPPMQSPSFPPGPQSQPPTSSRAREFRSAEDAVQGMSGGREELLPKIVHYGGVQPPTPPSPMPNHHQPPTSYPHHPAAPAHQQNHAPASYPEHRPDLSRTSSQAGRRRNREEYERENGSPATRQGEYKRYAQQEEDWRAGMSSREKREEFLRLCERAWDLFHS